MSDTQTVGLNDRQRELLLQGLRFVRSSVMLEIRDPSPEVDTERNQQLREIDALVRQLNGSASASTARV